MILRRVSQSRGRDPACCWFSPNLNWTAANCGSSLSPKTHSCASSPPNPASSTPAPTSLLSSNRRLCWSSSGSASLCGATRGSPLPFCPERSPSCNACPSDTLQATYRWHSIFGSDRCNLIFGPFLRSLFSNGALHKSSFEVFLGKCRMLISPVKSIYICDITLHWPPMIIDREASL